MVQASVVEQFDPNWTMFTQQQKFEPIHIGAFESKTLLDGRARLDDLLDAVQVPYERYLIYCEARKVIFYFIYYSDIIADIFEKARSAEALLLDSLQG